MSLSPFHVIIVLVLGVLFFGKNLPGIAKQIGSALLEFRKGVDEWKEGQANRKSGGQGRKSEGLTSPDDEPAEKFESSGTKFVPPSENEQ